MDSVPDDFLGTLDGMIESTEEFILDDTSDHSPSEALDLMVRADHVRTRMVDLFHLESVRKLYLNVYQSQEG